MASAMGQLDLRVLYLSQLASTRPLTSNILEKSSNSMKYCLQINRSQKTIYDNMKFSIYILINCVFK